MDVRGELTEWDYVRAQWLHLKPRRAFRVVGYAILALFALAVCLAFGAASDGSVQVLPRVLAPVLALAGIAVVQWYLWRRIYRRQVSLQGTHAYSFTTNGVAVTSSHGSGQMSWAVFIKWREDSHLFLVYPADNLFHMVPKRWFQGDTDVSEFRALLAEHAGRRFA